MPITAHKVASHGAPVGGLVRADFAGGESFDLRGYWMHPTRRANIEVPIFQHAFYPTLKHTDLDVKNNITYRTVVIPSVAELHQAGIEAERAIFVAEVGVHPRYIKHRQFFRGEFPASVKTLARQQNIVFVFPASDMPLARLKRKKVLNYYRAAFSPLLIKGKHYTSGRMSFFFVAPKTATLGLRKSLNLEHLEEGWEQSVHPLFRRKVEAQRRQRKYEIELSQRVQKEIQVAVLPIVSSQFDIPVNSPEGRRLAQMMNDPKLAKDFIKATAPKSKSQRFAAVKRWVQHSFWPKLKDIVVTETGNALEDGARYAVRLAISVAFDRALDSLKNLPDPNPETSAKRVNKWRSSLKNMANKFDYNIRDTGSFGLGDVGFKQAPPLHQIKQQAHELERVAVELLKRIPGIGRDIDALDWGAIELIKVDITSSGHAVASVREDYIERMKHENNQLALGAFVNPSKVGTLKYYMPKISQELTLYLSSPLE